MNILNLLKEFYMMLLNWIKSKLNIYLVFLLIALASCAPAHHINLLKAANSNKVRSESLRDFESKINHLTKTSYGKAIIKLDLFGFQPRYSKFYSSQPHTSFFYNDFFDFDKDDKYFQDKLNYYDAKLDYLSRNNLLMQQKLNYNSDKKILELKNFVWSIHGRIRSNSIKANEEVFILSNKLDSYLSRNAATINKLTLEQKLFLLSKVLNALESIPVASPMLHYKITSPFGYRKDPISGRRKFHKGIDLRGHKYEPITATASGVVTHISSSSGNGCGKYVIIKHSKGLSSFYGHLEAIAVNIGQKISIGQIIALQGNTGKSTGDHLHYETRINEVQYDPKIFFEFK